MVIESEKRRWEKDSQSCSCSVSASDSKGRFKNNNITCQSCNDYLLSASHYWLPFSLAGFSFHIDPEVTRYSPIIQVRIECQRD